MFCRGVLEIRRSYFGVTMIMTVKSECSKISGPQECAGCGNKIHDKFLLKVRGVWFRGEGKEIKRQSQITVFLYLSNHEIGTN